MSIIELKVPTIGESVTEVTLSQWLKEDGEYVNMDEALCEFESDKATLEFPSEAAGKLIHVAAEGDDLKIGALIAKIDTSVKSTSSNGSSKADASSKKEPIEKQPKEDGETKKEHYAEGHPSPAAAKLIKESGVNKEDIKGTGKDGRITKEDVDKAIHQSKEESNKSPKEKTVASTSKSTQKSIKEFSREDRREKMSRMRRTIAKRLVSAKNNTAMLTTFNEVDLFNVMDLRKQVQDQFVEKYNIKLGFMSLFSKACAKVLMEMPQVNATLDGEELIYHDYVDISIAISTPSGLVVPPVHNVESLPLHEIEHRIKELADKARDGKLSLEEMTGGTFTITNGGVFGSMMSTPIINEPQSAILGMHAIQDRPTVINGEIMVRPMMYIALSYDHRVIDGSSSVTFLVKVKEMLEKPGLLLMDL